MEGMKVLFFVDDFKGGAGNVIQLITIGLREKGYEVVICCLGGTTPGRHNIDDTRVYRVRKLNNKYFSFLYQIVKSRSIINKEKPDCIISFLFGVSAIVNIALKGYNIPHIVSERSDPNYLKPSSWLKPLVENAYRDSSYIVVLFDIFKSIAGGKYTDKAIAIPNPVPKIECKRVNYYFDSHNIRFVTIANDTPPKGLDILIKSFAKVASYNKNITLRIYGTVGNDSISSMIYSLQMEKQIFHMGYTMNIEDVLSGSDVYIMPSRHEGFPNSLCEAMSAGKCCIATVCHDGIKELITDGVNGLLVTPNSVIDLSRAIEYIITQPCLIEKLGKEASLISSKYSMAKVLLMWEELINHSVLQVERKE